MVRNIVVLGGNSHPRFVDSVCEFLGVPPSNRILTKFSGGESRCEIKDSVRGKDVYIIQTFGCGEGGDRVNDHFMELCIMISACKTGSAQRVTAVMPMFPYSRQPDARYSKAGAPLTKQPTSGKISREYTFESVPVTPGPGVPRTAGLSNTEDITNIMSQATVSSARSVSSNTNAADCPSPTTKYTTHNYEDLSLVSAFESKPGYKHWVAQAGQLIANLLTCAGCDRVLTCDLHESTYQGFFDIPGLFPKSWLHNKRLSNNSV
jgi:ribose-phosphate pyrophosphokinase